MAKANVQHRASLERAYPPDAYAMMPHRTPQRRTKSSEECAFYPGQTPPEHSIWSPGSGT